MCISAIFAATSAFEDIMKTPIRPRIDKTISSQAMIVSETGRFSMVSSPSFQTREATA